MFCKKLDCSFVYSPDDTTLLAKRVETETYKKLKNTELGSNGLQIFVHKGPTQAQPIKVYI